MIRNFITETYLEGFIPELDQYLFTGETDWSKQKEKAEQEVLNDFINHGYQVRLLRPELYLDTTTEEEDIGNRNRAVVITTAFTATAVVTITGANETTDTFETAGTSTSITATGTTTFLLSSMFRYYKYSNTGTITADIFLVESIYDLFYAYKWLQLILENSTVSEGDKYDVQAKLFKQKYDDLWNSARFWYDKDDSGDLALEEQQQASSLRIIH